MNRIEPRSGVAIELSAGQTLTVCDLEGGQVSDLLAVNRKDVGEILSNGRTFDYNEAIDLTTGATLWSNRSNPMLEIVGDTVGRHDFLLTPCSEATFRLCYDDEPPHRGCQGNLLAALAPYGLAEDAIPTAFNCFMNVPVDGATGRLQVLPPLSKAGDTVAFRAAMDLVVGLTACSAPASNGGTYKPIGWSVE